MLVSRTCLESKRALTGPEGSIPLSSAKHTKEVKNDEEASRTCCGNRIR